MQNDTKRRIISTAASEEDIRNDDTLRPKFLTDYIGQKKAKEMMKVYIEAVSLHSRIILEHLQLLCSVLVVYYT